MDMYDDIFITGYSANNVISSASVIIGGQAVEVPTKKDGLRNNVKGLVM